MDAHRFSSVEGRQPGSNLLCDWAPRLPRRIVGGVPDDLLRPHKRQAASDASDTSNAASGCDLRRHRPNLRICPLIKVYPSLSSPTHLPPRVRPLLHRARKDASLTRSAWRLVPRLSEQSAGGLRGRELDAAVASPVSPTDLTRRAFVQIDGGTPAPISIHPLALWLIRVI